MSDEVIVLADRGEEQKVIEEEKQEWLIRVLLALGVKEEALNELQGSDLIDYLSMASIEVWSNYDGSIEVLRKDKVVAQWRVPELILIKSAPKWYYEIHLNEWALPFQMQRRRK